LVRWLVETQQIDLSRAAGQTRFRESAYFDHGFT
jgi:hypothetical protein